MSTSPANETNELAELLSEKKARGPLARFGRWWRVAAVLVIVLLALVLLRPAPGARLPRYRTQELSRGDLTVTVSTTGNLQPVNKVEVGSEVSGLIDEVLVDDNDRVKKGQVLARLDTSRLRDSVVNARAALASSEARVLQSAATVKESRANLARLRQVAELSGGKVPSKAELETGEATLERAVADEASAKAAVDQARAALNSAEVNLKKASILSPIDGVVLSREIEPGQTVQASFTAPVLFKLAEDLAKMELQVDIDEASVGQVRDGQSATFSVDAYPARKYPARISRVAYGSQTKDGVVSYKSILAVSNEDLSLRPGMTATAVVTTAERKGVLLVSNAALRFTPPATVSEGSRSLVSRLLPRPPGGASTRKTAGTNLKDGSARLYVLRDGQAEAVSVNVGVSDGRMTEVTGGALTPGMQVITDTEGSQP